MDKIPLDDAISNAIARLVNDSQQDEKRNPSHYEIEFEIQKAGLLEFDPNKTGSKPVGKMKRVKTVLIYALESNIEKAEKLSCSIINLVRSNGGFRKGSPNYVGESEILTLQELLKKKGILLSLDGNLSQLILEGLSAVEMTEALKNYVERAQKGHEDAALIVGTSKDLLEAVAAHVIQEKMGTYPSTANFPTLLGQAFIMLGMATSQDKKVDGEHPRKEIERNLFDLACSVNRLRNKQGTGHGRPFLPDLSNDEAIEAIKIMGIVSNRLLNKM